MWHLFKIGRIPGTNHYSNRICQECGGWKKLPWLRIPDISFKIMQSGKLIALAYNSEAFQQEPERLGRVTIYNGNVRAKEYEVVLSTSKHLFGREIAWVEVTNYSCLFWWFNAAIVLSDLIFCQYSGHVAIQWCQVCKIPFAFEFRKIYIAIDVVQVSLDDWTLSASVQWRLLPLNLVKPPPSKFGWPWLPWLHLILNCLSVNVGDAISSVWWIAIAGRNPNGLKQNVRRIGNYENEKDEICMVSWSSLHFCLTLL